MNDATNESAGCGDELGRACPIWRSCPVDDHADLVGERGGVLEVVRDEQDRDVEAGEQLVQLRADVRSSCARRARRAARRGAGPAGRARARARARRAGALRRRARADGRARGARCRSARGTRRPRAGARTRRSAERSCAGRARSPGRRARRAGARAARSTPRRRRTRLVVDGDATRLAAGRARRSRAARSSCRRRTARRARRVEPTSRLSWRPKDRRGTDDLVESERCHVSPMSAGRARRTMLIRTSTPLIASVASKFWSNSA